VASLTMAKVALSLRIKLPQESLERHVAASPGVIGTELAKQVQAFASKEQLGYYPPVDYLRSQEAVDTALLDALEQIAWVASNMAREEIRVRLRPVFASVRFESIHASAYTMPSVRPGQANAFSRLSEHYTPTAVKVDLLVTLIQKTERSGLERLAKQLATRWLKGKFAEFEVTSACSV
jgi:hypothetical protein